jgi:phosphatidylglycerophosphate synthase
VFKAREQYERTMRPVGRLLARTGLPPHAFTILSVLVAVVSAYAYGQSRAVEGSIILLLSAVVDMFDGGVARATGRVTRFGAVFDHVLDRYAECIVVAGIVWQLHRLERGHLPVSGMLMAASGTKQSQSGTRATVGLQRGQESCLIADLASSYYPPSRYCSCPWWDAVPSPWLAYCLRGSDPETRMATSYVETVCVR